MSIIQFIRILWAHRLLTVLTTVATLIGATVAVLVVPPSYEGTTRVMLNILKPDAVTGEVVPTNSARTFIATQRELVRDFGVAGQAAESLGWLDNPATLEAYKADNTQDGDLRRALAQRIIDRTKVDVVTGTNILAITFRGPSPDDARTMANALREAYIDTTLNSRRREATRNAEWYIQQAAKEKALLLVADAVKTDYEREIGIVMQDDKTDVETARLRALAAQSSLGGAMMSAPAAVQSSQAAIQLAQLDAQIDQAGKTLGPNHPQMVQLRAQRGTLAKVVAEDTAAVRVASEGTARAMSASAGAIESAVRQQTSRVIANRDKIERLTQLQAQVNLHRAQMEKSLVRASDLRQEAAVAESGITVLSEAVTPRNPSFPNKPLIFGGALGLGAAVGLGLSLLLELLRRRVRGIEDLQHIQHVPLLGVISTQDASHRGSGLAGSQKPAFTRRRRAFAA